MERFIVILLFISNGLLSQTHSQQIIKFVDNNLEKKVGDGLCGALIDKAYCKFNRRWKKIPNPSSKYYFYGNPIDSANVQPGDVVLFDQIIRYDGVKLKSHIGFVYSVTDGKVVVASQNCHGSISESKVTLQDMGEIFRPSFVSSIKISFYRMP